jgi:hypothetical protein
MLPFLKNKQEGGASAPIEAIERKPDDESAEYGMVDAIAEDMLEAFQKKDKRLLKSALEALCEYIQEIDEISDEEELE